MDMRLLVIKIRVGPYVFINIKYIVELKMYFSSLYLALSQVCYLGCYLDCTPFRDLPLQIYTGGSNTIEGCIKMCKNAGYAYAGGQYR